MNVKKKGFQLNRICFVTNHLKHVLVTINPAKTKVLYLFLLLIFSNCTEKQFCDSTYFVSSRKVQIDLTPKAKVALSNITSILDGQMGISYFDTKGRLESHYSYQIFFDLQEKDKNLYLLKSFYQDTIHKNGILGLLSDRVNDDFLSYETITKIPINQLIAERVNITTSNFKDYQGFKDNPIISTLSFESMFNAEEFKYKTITFKKGVQYSDGCKQDNSFEITVPNHIAQKLIAEFKIFIKEFNGNKLEK